SREGPRDGAHHWRRGPELGPAQAERRVPNLGAARGAPVFRGLQMLGGIAPSEMYQTFNMGMGFAIVAPEDAAKPIIRSLRPEVNARVVGSVERGRGVTVPPLVLSWTTYLRNTYPRVLCS